MEIGSRTAGTLRLRSGRAETGRYGAKQSFARPAAPDTGVGYGAIVDMGAYEFGSAPPVPGHLCPGDLNCDGVNDLDDINPFVVALVSRASYEAQYPACPWLNGDCNLDGMVNFNDINPFVTCLVVGGCP